MILTLTMMVEIIAMPLKEFLSSLDLCFPGEDKIKNIINKKYYDYANCGWVYECDLYKKALLELLMVFSIDPDPDYRGYASMFLFSSYF